MIHHSPSAGEYRVRLLVSVRSHVVDIAQGVKNEKFGYASLEESWFWVLDTMFILSNYNSVCRSQRS